MANDTTTKTLVVFEVDLETSHFLFNVLDLSTATPTEKVGGASEHGPYSMDPETYWYFNFVNAAVLGQAFALFGIATNLINIAIFVKMGFKEPINVSLLGLSISDFLSCLTLIWMNLTRTPGFTELDLPFDPFQIGYITGTWPHFIFIRASSCITAFITLERCLCVVFPLKVKEIITTKKVVLITVGLFLFVLAFAAPTFYTNRLAEVFSPELNKTLVTLVFTDDIDAFEPTVLALFGVVLPIATFILTMIFTVILVLALRKNAAWRDKATSYTSTTTPSSTNADSNRKTAHMGQAASRDVKVSKMVTLLSSLFIACFSPIVIAQIFIVAIPEFRKVDAEGNIMFLIFSFVYFLETANASFNIVIYYRRSSNYKSTFDALFYNKPQHGKGKIGNGRM